MVLFLLFCVFLVSAMLNGIVKFVATSTLMSYPFSFCRFLFFVSDVLLDANFAAT